MVAVGLSTTRLDDLIFQGFCGVIMEKNTNWKTILQDDIPDQWANEIDHFEAQIERKRQGAVADKVFAETRLRRGVYGQRYDNGKRHDGTETRDLVFPCGDLTKGPETVWDAPGMQRIKIPFGGLNAVQMDVLADLAEEYSDAVLHVTTRQDLQLHYVHIDDTPDLMRRVAIRFATLPHAFWLVFARKNRLMSPPIAVLCPRFCWGIPIAKILVANLRLLFPGAGRRHVGW